MSGGMVGGGWSGGGRPAEVDGFLIGGVRIVGRICLDWYRRSWLGLDGGRGGCRGRGCARQLRRSRDDSGRGRGLGCRWCGLNWRWFCRGGILLRGSGSGGRAQGRGRSFGFACFRRGD
jgi:hypothetical protein